MSELELKIAELFNSPEYKEYEKIHTGNLFSITRTLRQETMHSSFLSWLLDTSANHGLGDYPIKSFLRGLAIVKIRSENADSRLSNELNELFINIYDGRNTITEVNISVEFSIITPSKKRGRLDVLVEIKVSEKILPVIIENKVNSIESNDQTKLYYEWAEDKYSDKNIYYAPVYVFLIPLWNEKKPKQQDFIRFGYQSYVDYVLEPSIIRCCDEKTKNKMIMYLQCLSYQIDCEKGDRSMAVNKNEKDMLDDLYNKNKMLFKEMFIRLSNDEDESLSIYKSAKDLLDRRKHSKYCFDGEIYNSRSKLVYAVVAKYIDDNDPQTVNDLKKAFDIFNMIRSIDEAPESWSEYKTVKTKDGSKAYVDGCWGKKYFEDFITFVKEKYKYEIT